MKQITLTQLRKMKVLEIEASLPFELTADSDVLGVVSTQGIDPSTVKTKCPNCGLIYNAKVPDGKSYFFTIQKVPPDELDIGTKEKFPDNGTDIGGHNA